jgi:hypothetical protein
VCVCVVCARVGVAVRVETEERGGVRTVATTTTLTKAHHNEKSVTAHKGSGFRIDVKR